MDEHTINFDGEIEEYDNEYYYFDDEEYEEVEVDLSKYPSIPVGLDELQYGIFICDMLIRCGFACNESEARDLIIFQRVTVNEQQVPSPECILTEEDFYEGYITVEKYPEMGVYVVLDL